ncbi:MAG: hypothetical protein HY784_15690 [Chloroflexi bacterium]|nr:hypothetical protein [Chloroflexota bacterium]
MTLAVMADFGVTVERRGYDWFRVVPGRYRPPASTPHSPLPAPRSPLSSPHSPISNTCTARTPAPDAHLPRTHTCPGRTPAPDAGAGGCRGVPGGAGECRCLQSPRKASTPQSSLPTRSVQSPPASYQIESDASAASYFFAAPAITGRPVRVENMGCERSGTWVQRRASPRTSGRPSTGHAPAPSPCSTS